ncbi:circadian clock-controlled protein daywake-like [Plodia interpunctella]|uniref:circadian clock-controlled protein daywake-like n=1 Tax=Plodia interpunctella TaxID=58824 RepID=UPI0023681DB8|nr:circadian clock-controlled protein daywake-like [Plodia interpunctella]
MWRFTLLCLFLFDIIHSEKLPEYIKSCSRNDPNLNACALSSAKESIRRFSLGDPDRNLPPLDPLYVQEMTVFIPRKNGLKLVFSDNYFHGLADMDLLDLRFDLKKKIIAADALVNMDVNNNYDLSGRIMILPVKSNGGASIKLKNTTIHIRFWYEHVEAEDGKIHWKIYKHDIKYDVEKAVFRLENLLSEMGVGDQINIMINDLWREIVADVGPSICNSLSEAVVKNLAVLLDQVPYDDLMPDS